MPCYKTELHPCGKCPGCLSARSSDWAVRLGHELKLHNEASFITLTFEDDGVIDVDKETCQLFLKRLRKALQPKRIRYYLVSEYGERKSRPHYHGIIFGHDFSKDWGSTEVRKGLYTSPLLERAWGLGHVSTGSVTDASIRYVSNYVLSKEDAPKFMSLETGEERPRLPVFALMSRKPGIGGAWIDRHSGETYRDDDVVSGSFRRRPPRYYDQRTFGSDALALQALRLARREKKMSKIRCNPSRFYANLNPLRKEAAVKLDRAKRAMKPRGNL